MLILRKLYNLNMQVFFSLLYLYLEISISIFKFFF